MEEIRDVISEAAATGLQIAVDDPSAGINQKLAKFAVVESAPEVIQDVMVETGDDIQDFMGTLVYHAINFSNFFPFLIGGQSGSGKISYTNSSFKIYDGPEPNLFCEGSPYATPDEYKTDGIIFSMDLDLQAESAAAELSTNDNIAYPFAESIIGGVVIYNFSGIYDIYGYFWEDDVFTDPGNLLNVDATEMSLRLDFVIGPDIIKIEIRDKNNSNALIYGKSITGASKNMRRYMNVGFSYISSLGSEYIEFNNVTASVNS